MGKPLGIAAFVILLLSIPIPVLGIYMAFIGLVLGGVSGLLGDKTWPIVVAVVGFVVLYWLSPMWYLVMNPPKPIGMEAMPGVYAQAARNALFAKVATGVAVALPIIGLAISQMRGSRSTEDDTPDTAE